MPKDLSEQRRHPRIIVDVFADWGWGPECEYYDKVTSLSLSGLFLATRRELRAGDEIFVKLSGEPAGKIHLKGVIRYQLRVMEGDPPHGAGVEFVDVSADSARKLEAIMNSYK